MEKSNKSNRSKYQNTVLDILHRAKFLLNQKSTKDFSFSFIHSYITYDNIAWGSTSKTKLKKRFTHQKKAARAIFFADRLAYAKPLMHDHECTQYLPNKYISKLDSTL